MERFTADAQSTPEAEDAVMSSSKQSEARGHKKRRVSDAFSVLLSSRQQSRKKSSKQQQTTTTFVLCPICHVHVAKVNIHRHLDQCTTGTSSLSSVGKSHKPSVSSAASTDGKNKAQTTRRTNKFVPCPVCQVHVAEINIHHHLDKCVNTTKVEAGQDPGTEDGRKQVSTSTSFAEALPESKTTNEGCAGEEEEGDAGKDKLHGAGTKPDSTTPNNHKSDSIQGPNNSAKTSVVASEAPTTEGRSKKATATDQNKKNAFSHMLEQSRKLSTKEQRTPDFCFHLQDDHGAVVMLSPAGSEAHTPLAVAWQAIVRVSDRSQDPSQHFFVSLSSVVPSDNSNTYLEQPPQRPRHRWVRRHSSLSVPVLKSMLQKSIRRRKPLPSVRIAMELADKSLEDLLRRLPIIVLEDSTLHPQFPFLVWLMMAQSSSTNPFEMPRALMERVFGIIFELASCRLKDALPNDRNDGTGTENVSLSSLIQLVVQKPGTSEQGARDVSEMALQPISIFIRSCYGGMHGDIRMLQRYASLWYNRFRSDYEPNRSPLPKTLSKLGVSLWAGVPSILHQTAQSKVPEFVVPIVRAGLDRLSMSDACCAGVDFHCSNIMDHLLNDSWLTGVASDIVFLSNDHPNFNSLGKSDRKGWLERSWKSAMWGFCSGVNHRLSLLGEEEPHPDPGPEGVSDSAATKVWKELVSPKAAEFQKNFVSQRLAPPS